MVGKLGFFVSCILDERVGKLGESRIFKFACTWGICSSFKGLVCKQSVFLIENKKNLISNNLLILR